MEEVTRRDAIKAAGVLGAVSVATVASGAKVTAQESKTANSRIKGKAALKTMSASATVEHFISTASSAAEASSTPEEAYKRFMSVAGAGMTQVMAAALAAAVGKAVELTAAKDGVKGWERYITGAQIMMDFGSPIDRFAITGATGGASPAAGGFVPDFQKALVTQLHDIAVSEMKTTNAVAAELLGGEISCSGTWRF